MRRLHSIPILFALALAASANGAHAATLVFNDKADWQSGLSAVRNFSLDATNVVLASELTTAPADRDRLGLALNFAGAETGLPMNFSFNVDPTEGGPVGSNEIIYVENPFGNGLGVATTGTEHDWRVDIASASGILALGMTIRGSGDPHDSFIFKDVFGASLGSFDGGGDLFFVGIISDQDIGQFLYDDSIDSGGRILVEMSIGDVAPVPVPAALSLFISAFAVFGPFGWRRTLARKQVCGITLRQA